MDEATPQVTMHLRTLDWAVIIAYAVGVLGAGWYFSRKNKSAEDFLVGGRNMSPWTVGLSFFVAVFSTLTYLARPGEMALNGPVTVVGLLALPLVFWLVGWFLIPTFMRLRVTSGNELLERRLGPVVRQTGVTFYLCLRLLWMGLILYATVEKVVIPMIGLPPEHAWMVRILVAVITIIYTSMGGLKAIVAIDAAQSFLLFGGVVLSIALACYYVGDATAFWPKQWSATWAHPNWVDESQSDRTILVLLVMLVVWNVATAGSDQMAIQRYAATKDIAAARKMLAVSLVAQVIILLLLCGLGVALYAYAMANPGFIPPGETLRTYADDLFPQFIIQKLPVGIAGLIIAGLLAEAMNSLSSGVSATGTVVVKDLIGPFRRGFRRRRDVRGFEAAGIRDVPAKTERAMAAAEVRDPAADVRLAQWVSVFLGVVVVLISSVVANISGNLFDLSQKVVNLFTVPLFGLFFMAIFVRFARPFGTLLGSFAGLAVVATLYYWVDVTGRKPPISFLWGMPLALVTQVIVGVLASLLPIGTRADARDPDGYAPLEPAVASPALA